VDVTFETAHSTTKLQPDWFATQNVREKLAKLRCGVEAAFDLTAARKDFKLGRDLQIVQPSQLPPKPGLFKPEGQGRLLHDLASIELQAMELAVRSLYEFPEAPTDFRTQLAELALGEGRHLELCLDAMDDLGFPWGSWDAHLTLWNAVSSTDTLLDRILIVHRYLEGAGLDAGESILRRMQGVKALRARPVVETIVKEEVDHVLFGSRWYHAIALLSGVDPEKDFELRIGQIAREVPRRERLARELRKSAGFTDFELNVLESHCDPLGRRNHV
jgi:uncharacterized ferritin-like protein (DUF455 family)